MRFGKFYFIGVASNLLNFAACQLKTPTEILDSIPGPEIKQFSIGGVPGTINGNSIYVELRWTGVNHRNAIATFSDVGGRVTVDGVVQKNGVSANDFGSARTYTVQGFEGAIRTYTVTTQGGYPIADTGQTQCASGANGDSAMAACPQSVAGQDGNSVNLPTARSFTGPTQHAVFTSDYLTTDSVTGLIWRSCSEGQSGVGCIGSAITVNWATAGTTCSALNNVNAGNGYAGKTNWRLPHVQELATLNLLAGGSLAIDTIYFPNTPNGDYWTSTPYAPDTNQSWRVYTGVGISNNSAKTTLLYVRCVAGGSNSYTPSRNDLGGGTVRDLSTNLIWQKCSSGQTADASCSGAATTGNWVQALNYCSTLVLAGRTWRLPNIAELQSIADFDVSFPAIAAADFPNTSSQVYWSSSTYESSPASARSVDFSNGFPYYSVKSSLGHTRCVATGP